MKMRIELKVMIDFILINYFNELYEYVFEYIIFLLEFLVVY